MIRKAWWLASLLLCQPALADELVPELQLGLKSLRPGELARLEKAAGPLAEQPLYRADLTVDMANRKVVGRVALTWTVKGPTLDELYLRTTPNGAHTDAVAVMNATINGQPAVLDHPDATLWRVQLPIEAVAGTVVHLEVQVQAKVPAQPTQGEEVLDHGAFSAGPDFASLVGLLPMVPPEKANGELFSAPSGMGDLSAFAPASFIVSVSAPRGFQVVMPGVALGEVPETNGRVRFTNAIVGSRDFPVFVARGLERLTVNTGDVTVEAWATKGHANAKVVLDHAVFAVKELHKRVGPFAWNTFRVVEAPLARGAGGMEFPGLVTVASSLVSGASDPLSALGLGGLITDPAMNALVGPMLKDLLKTSLEFTVLHEVAHQYVACLVGSDAVDEPVADEPLTQHLALLLLEWRKGKKAANDVREGQVKMAYQLWRMMGGRDSKANRPTGEFTSTTEYAGIVYGKAPLLFDAQRKLVGEDTWERTLKAYVEQYRYRWVTSKTLTEVAAKQSPSQGRQLDVLRRHWLEETHGDEDVGTMNLEELLQGTQQGNPSDAQLDPEAMKMLNDLLKQLGGE
ncbi:MAG: M1 family metallopeptidase [Archangiaceae bacterium]|nr:M1 family metallopeptidase [Archangiaceae bacterium]